MSGGFIYGDHFHCSHDHMSDEVVTMEKIHKVLIQQIQVSETFCLSLWCI